MNWFNKKESDDFDPYELDWGYITAEKRFQAYSVH